MSWKMFNHMIPKGVFWSATAELRERAFYESPLSEIARAVIWANYYDTMARLEAWDKVREDPKVALRGRATFADYDIELQVFDMARAPRVEGYSDTCWMVRPLEMGHWLDGRMREHPLFEPVTYCTSTDVPPEEEKNRELAIWLDQEITAGNYLLYSIVNREMYALPMMGLHMRNGEGR